MAAMYTFQGLMDLTEKIGTTKDTEESANKPELVPELKKIINELPTFLSSGDSKSDDNEQVANAEKEFMKAVVNIVHSQSPLNSPKKVVLNEATGSCSDSSGNMIDPVDLLSIIAKLCTQENVKTIIDCGLVCECMKSICSTNEPTNYICHCVRILEVVLPLDKDICSELVSTHKPVTFKLCVFYDLLDSVEEKCRILSVLNSVIKHALTLDDDLFDVMFYKVCSVLLNIQDDKILINSLICLDNFIELYQEWEVNKKLHSMGLIPKLVTHLSHPNEEIVARNLRCVGNLLSAEDLTINWCVIFGGVLNQLQTLLLHSDRDVVIAAIWAVSNVAAGPDGSTKYFFDFNVIPVLLHYLQCKDGKTANEALWALANLLEDSSAEQRKRILSNKEVIKCFVQCLSVEKYELQEGGLVSYELMRDTFKTIVKCISPPKDTSESQSEANDEDSSDDDDNNGKKKNHGSFDIFTTQERKDFVVYLEEFDCAKSLKLLSVGGGHNDKDLKEAFIDIFKDYQLVLDEFEIVVSDLDQITGDSENTSDNVTNNDSVEES